MSRHRSRRHAPTLTRAAAPAPAAHADRTADQMAAILRAAPPAQRQAFTSLLLQLAPITEATAHESARGGTPVGTLLQDGRLDDALATLRDYTPVLHQHPQTIQALESLLQRAHATQDAMTRTLRGDDDSGPGWPSSAHATGPKGGVAYASAAPQSPSAFLLTRGDFPTADAGERRIGSGGWTGTASGQGNQPSAVGNAALLRLWADQVPPIQSAIKARKQQIASAAIDVLPTDETAKFDKKLQARLQALLRWPNRYRQNWAELSGMVTTDLLVLDRGCIEKNLDMRRQPVELRAKDGGTIKVYPDWDGDPKTPRYLYEEPNWGRKVPLRNDELIVLMDNAATYRLGWSPVQAARDIILQQVAAFDSAGQYVGKEPPLHVFNFKGASQSAVDNLRTKYESEMAGQRKVMFTGADEMQVINLMRSAKDNQWLEWQEFLIRLTCMTFQISPQQLGITFDINKATAASQQEIYEDNGQIPLYLLWERYLNNELLADFAPRNAFGYPDLDALNLAIRFPDVTEAARLQHMERAGAFITPALGSLPYMTLNQALLALGEEPVPGGNTFFANTTNGPVPWLSYDNDLGMAQPPAQPTTDPNSPLAALEGGGSDDDNAPSFDGDSDTSGPGSNPAPAQAANQDVATPDVQTMTQPTLLAGLGSATLDRRRAGTIWTPRTAVSPAALLRGQREPQMWPVPYTPAPTPIRRRSARRAATSGTGTDGINWSAFDAEKERQNWTPTPGPHAAHHDHARDPLSGPRLGEIGAMTQRAHHRPQAEIVAREELRSDVAQVFTRTTQRRQLPE